MQTNLSLPTPPKLDNFIELSHLADVLRWTCTDCRSDDRQTTIKACEAIAKRFGLSLDIGDIQQQRLQRNARIKAKGAKKRAVAFGLTEHFTAQEWLALIAYYDSRCCFCGTQGQMTADHVVPLSNGGTNRIDNIQPLCERCRRHFEVIGMQKDWRGGAA